MRLPPFELVEPENLEAAVELAGRADGEVRLVAGGTALLSMMRLGLIRPDRVVSLHRVPGLDGIREVVGALEVGAMVTMARLHRAPAVRRAWPVLAEAAAAVATPGIRSAATVGGNLAYGEAASDPAPALLCLEADVEVVGPSGRRAVPIGELFTGFYETSLGPAEIVTGLRVPALPPGARSGYVKYSARAAEDKPLVGVAAVVVPERSGGRWLDVRIGLAGVAPTARRARRAEARLTGQEPDDAALRAGAEAAAAECEPLSDLMGSADYRREMVRVWVRRLLTALRDGSPAPRAG